jgi:hypothetical protein
VLVAICALLLHVHICGLCQTYCFATWSWWICYRNVGLSWPRPFTLFHLGVLYIPAGLLVAAVASLWSCLRRPVRPSSTVHISELISATCACACQSSASGLLAYHDYFEACDAANRRFTLAARRKHATRVHQLRFQYSHLTPRHRGGQDVSSRT